VRQLMWGLVNDYLRESAQMREQEDDEEDEDEDEDEKNKDE